MGNNKGNPYHDPKTGRFTSGPSALSDADLMDIQIRRSREQAASREGSQVEEKPLDLRGKIREGLHRWYTEKAKSRGQRYYDQMKRAISEDPNILNGIDVKNPAQVSQFALNFVSQHIDPNSKERPLCHDIAGVTAAILDHARIKYECFNGYCSGDPFADRTIKQPTHTWIHIPDTDIVYEYYQDHPVVYHHNILSDIVFKK